ncbi:MAG: EAL domain-containing protein [Actinobacteria bacterium]|nr:EAL domain-containing protein [Actinomycetota bacterium]
MGRSRWPMGLRLRNLRIGPKLALLSLLPTMAFLFYAIHDTVQDHAQVADVRAYSAVLDLSVEVMSTLGNERFAAIDQAGLAPAATESERRAAADAVRRSRAETDAALEAFAENVDPEAFLAAVQLPVGQVLDGGPNSWASRLVLARTATDEALAKRSSLPQPLDENQDVANETINAAANSETAPVTDAGEPDTAGVPDDTPVGVPGGSGDSTSLAQQVDQSSNGPGAVTVSQQYQSITESVGSVVESVLGSLPSNKLVAMGRGAVQFGRLVTVFQQRHEWAVAIAHEILLDDDELDTFVTSRDQTADYGAIRAVINETYSDITVSNDDDIRDMWRNGKTRSSLRAADEEFSALNTFPIQVLDGRWNTLSRASIEMARGLFDQQLDAIRQAAQEENSRARNNEYKNLLLMFMITSVTLLLAWFSRRGIVRPLQDVAAAATSLASGRRPPPVKYQSHDEIGMVAHSFRSLSQTMTALLDETRRLNTAIRNGAFDVQGDVDSFDGDWAELVRTMNHSLRRFSMFNATITGEARRQVVVAHLGAEALAGMPMSQLYDQAVHSIVESMGWCRADLYEFGADRSQLIRRATTEVHPASEVDQQLLPNDQVTRVAAYSGPTTPLHPGMRTAMLATIEHRDGILGFVIVESSKDLDVTDDNVAFLQQLTQVISNAQQRRAAEEHIRYQANHDELTGLPNRNLFEQRLRKAMTSSTTIRKVAIAFIDVDRFKFVNDTYGHGTGDQILQMIAMRLRSLCRPADTVARFGGDEFLVLFECSHPMDRSRFAQRLASAFDEPFVLPDHTIHLRASIGIANAADIDLTLEHRVVRSGHDGEDRATAVARRSETLIRDADTAMYEAKQQPESHIYEFDTVLRSKVVKRAQIEHNLRGAIQRNQLSLEFQAIVEARTGRLHGYEALCRWSLDGVGRVSPNEFIPVAEETGLIADIGEYVIAQAARDYPQLAAGTATELPVIAINVSTAQLSDESFPDLVARTLAATPVPANRVVLEITETAMSRDPHMFRSMLDRLRALGVQISIDDFGTGYSAFSYLTDLPVNSLKVDRSFVTGIERSSTEKVVGSTVSMAHDLGLQVVAEGVETIRQLEVLTDLGCDYVQGYLFSRPLTLAELQQRGIDLRASWISTIDPRLAAEY